MGINENKTNYVITSEGCGGGEGARRIGNKSHVPACVSHPFKVTTLEQKIKHI
jgi:hypothetical protein